MRGWGRWTPRISRWQSSSMSTLALSPTTRASWTRSSGARNPWLSTWRRWQKLSRGSGATSHHRRHRKKMKASRGGLEERGSYAQSWWAVGERHRAARSYQALLPRRGPLMAVVAQTHSTSTWHVVRHGTGLHQHMSNILVVTMGALQITLLARYLSK
jgi:hypothetical protein